MAGSGRQCCMTRTCCLLHGQTSMWLHSHEAHHLGSGLRNVKAHLLYMGVKSILITVVLKEIYTPAEQLIVHLVRIIHWINWWFKWNLTRSNLAIHYPQRHHGRPLGPPYHWHTPLVKFPEWVHRNPHCHKIGLDPKYHFQPLHYDLQYRASSCWNGGLSWYQPLLGCQLRS